MKKNVLMNALKKKALHVEVSTYVIIQETKNSSIDVCSVTSILILMIKIQIWFILQLAGIFQVNIFLVLLFILNLFKGEIIDDFKLVAGYQLNVKPEAVYANNSVERCATVCSYMESFICRSFDYLIDENFCLMYKENVKDNIHSNVELIPNKNSNHYSSIIKENKLDECF